MAFCLAIRDVSSRSTIESFTAGGGGSGRRPTDGYGPGFGRIAEAIRVPDAAEARALIEKDISSGIEYFYEFAEGQRRRWKSVALASRSRPERPVSVAKQTSKDRVFEVSD